MSVTEEKNRTKETKWWMQGSVWSVVCAMELGLLSESSLKDLTFGVTSTDDVLLAKSNGATSWASSSEHQRNDTGVTRTFGSSWPRTAENECLQSAKKSPAKRARRKRGRVSRLTAKRKKVSKTSVSDQTLWKECKKRVPTKNTKDQNLVKYKSFQNNYDYASASLENYSFSSGYETGNTIEQNPNEVQAYDFKLKAARNYVPSKSSRMNFNHQIFWKECKRRASTKRSNERNRAEYKSLESNRNDRLNSFENYNPSSKYGTVNTIKQNATEPEACNLKLEAVQNYVPTKILRTNPNDQVLWKECKRRTSTRKSNRKNSSSESKSLEINYGHVANFSGDLNFLTRYNVASSIGENASQLRVHDLKLKAEQNHVSTQISRTKLDDQSLWKEYRERASTKYSNGHNLVEYNSPQSNYNRTNSPPETLNFSKYDSYNPVRRARINSEAYDLELKATQDNFSKISLNSRPDDQTSRKEFRETALRSNSNNHNSLEYNKSLENNHDYISNILENANFTKHERRSIVEEKLSRQENREEIAGIFSTSKSKFYDSKLYGRGNRVFKKRLGSKTRKISARLFDDLNTTLKNNETKVERAFADFPREFYDKNFSSLRNSSSNEQEFVFPDRGRFDGSNMISLKSGKKTVNKSLEIDEISSNDSLMNFESFLDKNPRERFEKTHTRPLADRIPQKEEDEGNFGSNWSTECELVRNVRGLRSAQKIHKVASTDSNKPPVERSMKRRTNLADERQSRNSRRSTNVRRTRRTSETRIRCTALERNDDGKTVKSDTSENVDFARATKSPTHKFHDGRRVTRGLTKINKENFVGKLVWGFCSGWWPAEREDSDRAVCVQPQVQAFANHQPLANSCYRRNYSDASQAIRLQSHEALSYVDREQFCEIERLAGRCKVLSLST